ncbi:MAG: hypothetical protein ACTSUE_26235 [Promethearchaeota archaeon]
MKTSKDETVVTRSKLYRNLADTDVVMWRGIVLIVWLIANLSFNPYDTMPAKHNYCVGGAYNTTQYDTAMMDWKKSYPASYMQMWYWTHLLGFLVYTLMPDLLNDRFLARHKK